MSTDGPSPSIDDLIERSSLGSPTARAARKSVSPADRERIVRYAVTGRFVTGSRPVPTSVAGKSTRGDSGSGNDR